ncbi:MAG: serine protease [Bacteroidota bacterium]
MNKFLLVLVFFWTILLNSQYLEPRRVAKLKASVVRVMYKNIPIGSGFFISKDGFVVTCNHVIKPFLKRVPKPSNLNLYFLDNVFIQLSSGEKLEVGGLEYLLDKGYEDSFKNDYFILKTKELPPNSVEALKLGSWSDVKEGDVVYASGHPFGIEHNSMSTGIISSKFADKRWYKLPLKDTIRHRRESAFIDVTINRGNSGGPLIKKGRKPKHDRVIGIVSFMATPLSPELKQLKVLYQSESKKLPKNQVSNIKTIGLILKELENNSFGIGGAISIDYLSAILKSGNL